MHFLGLVGCGDMIEYSLDGRLTESVIGVETP
jgi:hypothetical protein